MLPCFKNTYLLIVKKKTLRPKKSIKNFSFCFTPSIRFHNQNINKKNFGHYDSSWTNFRYKTKIIFLNSKQRVGVN